MHFVRKNDITYFLYILDWSGVLFHFTTRQLEIKAKLSLVFLWRSSSNLASTFFHISHLDAQKGVYIYIYLEIVCVKKYPQQKA